MEIPEHPVIDRMLRNGYPIDEKQNAIHCEDCEVTLSDDDDAFIFDGDYLCEKCVKERIEEQYPIKTIAELLEIACKSAYLLQEDE